jgi:hypothetical protein
MRTKPSFSSPVAMASSERVSVPISSLLARMPSRVDAPALALLAALLVLIRLDWLRIVATILL